MINWLKTLQFILSHPPTRPSTLPRPHQYPQSLSSSEATPPSSPPLPPPPPRPGSPHSSSSTLPFRRTPQCIPRTLPTHSAWMSNKQACRWFRSRYSHPRAASRRALSNARTLPLQSSTCPPLWWSTSRTPPSPPWSTCTAQAGASLQFRSHPSTWGSSPFGYGCQCRRDPSFRPSALPIRTSPQLISRLGGQSSTLKQCLHRRWLYPAWSHSMEQWPWRGFWGMRLHGLCLFKRSGWIWLPGKYQRAPCSVCKCQRAPPWSISQGSTAPSSRFAWFWGGWHSTWWALRHGDSCCRRGSRSTQPLRSRVTRTFPRPFGRGFRREVPKRTWGTSTTINFIMLIVLIGNNQLTNLLASIGCTLLFRLNFAWKTLIPWAECSSFRLYISTTGLISSSTGLLTRI